MDPRRFGMPPPDAVEDVDALAGALGMPNKPFLEDSPDIPRVLDANPFKTTDGEQKLTPRGGLDAEMPGAMDDEEAIQAAILDQAMAERELSRAYQQKQVEINEDEADQKRREEMGEA